MLTSHFGSMSTRPTNLPQVVCCPTSVPTLPNRNFCSGQLLLIQLSPWYAAKRLAGNAGFTWGKLVTGVNWQCGNLTVNRIPLCRQKMVAKMDKLPLYQLLCH